MGNLIIKEVSRIESVEVQKSITIESGSRYTISSSYGYAGIGPGKIAVMDISRKGSSVALDNTIESWVDSAPGDREELESGIWVSYVYLVGDDRDINYLPLETFIDHISVQ